MTRTSLRCIQTLRCCAVAGLTQALALAGCYGAAPPRPHAVTLPPLHAGASITVASKNTTRMESVRKEARSCPHGHTDESPDCVVTHYQETEPVTRTTTTASYGGTQLNYAQFLVLTDPNYDNKLAQLEQLSNSCSSANVPRWVGAGLVVAGLVALGASSSYDSDAMMIGADLALAGGITSYALGYYTFGGKRCGEARHLYHKVELAPSEATTTVSGAAAAREMERRAAKFNDGANAAGR